MLLPHLGQPFLNGDSRGCHIGLVRSEPCRSVVRRVRGLRQCAMLARRAGERVVARVELVMLRRQFLQERLATRKNLRLVPLLADHALGVGSTTDHELPPRHSGGETVNEFANGALDNFDLAVAHTRVHRSIGVDILEVLLRFVQGLRGCHCVRLVLG